MTKWAGIIITTCGIMHTLGSLIQAAPTHHQAWFAGQLWEQATYPGMGEAGVAWWYSMYSFGPMLLLLGLLVLSLGRRRLEVPGAIPWALAGWVVLGTVASGPSPLLLLLIASGLLLVDSRRSRRQTRPSDESAEPGVPVGR